MKEGSFDGEMSEFDFDQDIQSVKTPDQIPERLDFSQVPDTVLRSGVIESLINQNDDLMARLNVSLRRVAQLEEKIVDARNESAQHKSKHDNLKDQVLVLREQSRILAQRARTQEEKQNLEQKDISQQREQIQLLEVRYAELYTSAQKRQQIQQEEIRRANAATYRYKKYRKNVRMALAPLRAEIVQLREKRQALELTLQDLRNNMSQTTEYISEQSKEHKSQILNLTDDYENKIRELSKQIQVLSEDNLTLANRAKDSEQIFNDKVKIENELIIAQRREEELHVRTAAEISEIQKTLARYRNEAKDLALQLEGKIQELEENASTMESLKAENKGFSEQVETLQLLWRDQQNQIEKMAEQKNSLQKLNQELSIAINEYRREIRELKEKLQDEQIRSTELKELQAAQNVQIQEITAQQAQATHKNEPTIKREDVITPELMAKIDQAISSLHSCRPD